MAAVLKKPVSCPYQMAERLWGYVYSCRYNNRV